MAENGMAWEAAGERQYKRARTDIAKLIEAIDHLRRDGNDGYADKHADLLVARVRADWSL